MLVSSTEEYDEWFAAESAKSQAQILDRIHRLERYDHFGECKYLGNNLAELKWKNGRRVYFVRLKTNEVLLISGGGKNGQNKDISQAYKILKAYTKG